MDLDEISEWRRARMKALSEAFGGDKPLGIALGYANGAYVGQMSSGHRPISEKTVNKAHDLPGYAGWFDMPTTVKQLTKVQENAVVVPVLSAVASMGAGHEHQDEDVMTSTLTLSPHFIQERIRPTRPEALAFITGYGDSMRPTIESGDVLLVDTGIRQASISGIYVLSAHNRLFIKRVSQRMDGSFSVSSDNPSEKTVEVLNGDHHVEILGRVVWVWNGRKL